MAYEESGTVRAHVRYPDDPPTEWVYREDGSVAQVEGVERDVEFPGWQLAGGDVPTVTVRIEHSDEWKQVWP